MTSVKRCVLAVQQIAQVAIDTAAENSFNISYFDDNQYRLSVSNMMFLSAELNLRKKIKEGFCKNVYMYRPNYGHLFHIPHWEPEMRLCHEFRIYIYSVRSGPDWIL